MRSSQQHDLPDLEQVVLVVIAVLVIGAAALQYARALPVVQRAMGNAEFACDVADFH